MARGDIVHDSRGRKTLELYQDNDGVVIAQLTLYENSGYTRGYFKTLEDEGTTGRTGVYTKVQCELTAAPAAE